MGRWLGKILTGSAAGTPPAGWYASTTGNAGNNGSIGSPWDLQTALNGGPSNQVQPGDTILVRGGTYTGAFHSSLTGTSGTRIYVRNYPGERPIVDAAGAGYHGAIFSIGGGYTRYQGFEVIDSNPAAQFAPSGISSDTSGPYYGIEIVNNIVHDVGGSGLTPWSDFNGVTVYGNLVYFNGRTMGNNNYSYGAYLQNSSTNADQVTENNIFGLNWGPYTLHAYTAGGQLDHMKWRKNAVLMGRETGNEASGRLWSMIGKAQDDYTHYFEATDNLFYSGPWGGDPYALGQMDFGWDEGFGLDGAVIQRNFIGCGYIGFIVYSSTVGGVNGGDTGNFNTMSGVAQHAGYWTYGPAGSFPNNTFVSVPPVSNWVMVWPNAYEQGRGHLYCVDWANAGSQAFDLSSILSVNDTYEILDAFNYFDTPLKTGTYAGGSVTVTLPGSPTVATPLALPDWPGPAPPAAPRTAPPHTKPCWALVVRKT